jgi:hypothetical protein
LISSDQKSQASCRSVPLFFIHWTISGFLMYIYSTPMCWQYIASRCAIISVSVEGPCPLFYRHQKQCLNLQMKVQNCWCQGRLKILLSLTGFVL